MVVKTVNSTRFDIHQLQDATEFFNEHGFVVLRDILSDRELQGISSGWESLITDASQKVGLDKREFETRFPQNRDLWRKNDTFKELLFDSAQAEVAASLLGVSGVRLFHDHAITKPTRESSTIPWHQDNAYWPIDRAGLSLWTPVDDVDVDGGCLTILAGSHLDGPEPPQDFLSQTSSWQEDDPRLTHIPVQRGETVILHGLTWHASYPNRSKRDRLAYLTLWVPATSRYQTDTADWHPTARFIDVEPGNRLDGEFFPLFGEVASEDEGKAVSFPPPENISGLSMFKAGHQISSQLSWLLNQPEDSIATMVSDNDADTIAATAVASGITPAANQSALADLLNDLAMNEKVRRESVARDVYLHTIQQWWQLAGARIDEVMTDG